MNPSIHKSKQLSNLAERIFSILPVLTEISKLVELLPMLKLPNPIPNNESEKRKKKDSLKNLYFLSPPPQ